MNFDLLYVNFIFFKRIIWKIDKSELNILNSFDLNSNSNKSNKITINKSKESEIFKEMFLNLSKDLVRLNLYLKTIIHFIKEFQLNNHIKNITHNKSNEISTQTGHNNKNDLNSINKQLLISNSSLSNFEPVVLVVNNGIFVKMTCPKLNIIKKHSYELFILLEVLFFRFIF